jgi:hypothetical protein
MVPSASTKLQSNYRNAQQEILFHHPAKGYSTRFHSQSRKQLQTPSPSQPLPLCLKTGIAGSRILPIGIRKALV